MFWPINHEIKKIRIHLIRMLKQESRRERTPPTDVAGVRIWTWRYKWVEFAGGSRLAPRVFLWVLAGFPSSTKTNIYKFQFDQDRGRE